MAFHCKVCNVILKSKQALDYHNNISRIHLENQAVYDNDLERFYKTEIERLQTELKQVRDLLEDNQKLSRERTQKLVKAEEKIKEYEKQSWIKTMMN